MASATNNEEVPSDAYTHHSLEEVLATAAGGFHALVKSGYPKMKIPPLDPLKLPTLSETIGENNSHIDATINLNEPVLKGLDTIKLARAPEVDFEAKKIYISLAFSKLELSCEDYDREATYKILFKDRDISKLDRTLTVTLTDVTMKLSFNLGFTHAGPVISVNEAEELFEIGKLKTDLESSLLFNLVAPMFKRFIGKFASAKLQDVIGSFLTEKLQAICVAQAKNVKMLEGLYKTKQKQGLLVDADGNKLKPRILQGFNDVGQLSYPMFWDVPRVPVDKLGHMSIADVIATGKTGDLICFQTVAPGSFTIRRFTQSPFSHVTMIIKEPDLFDGKAVMIQATSSEHYDLIQKKNIKGIQVNHIDDFLNEYNGDFVGNPKYPYDAVAVFRRLNCDVRSDEKKFTDALVNFMKETNGTPYAEHMSMNELYAAGVMEIDIEEKTGKTFYCASYIAEACIRYGIITDKFANHQYGPRDFSMKYNTLPFANDSWSYGPETVVDPN